MPRFDNELSREYRRSFFSGNWARFVSALVFTLLDVPAALIGSWILGQIIDSISSNDFTRILHLAVLSAVFVVVSTLISLGMYRAKSSFICRALVSYKALAFRRLTEKGVQSFSRENTGSYLSVLTNDVSSIEENYLKRSFLLLHQSVLLVSTICMMVWYSPQLALVAVALSILPLVVSTLMGREFAARERDVSDENERFLARLKDLLNGFSVIKGFHAEGEARRLFEQRNCQVEAAKRRRYWWECLVGAISGNLCASVLQFGVFLVGAVLAATNQITIGSVLIFLNLCNYIIGPINVIPQYLASRRAALHLIDKLAAVTENDSDRKGRTISPPALRHSIKLKDVCFRYPGGTPALSEVSLSLPSGGMYAVVGPSGSGKTTLLNLLSGSFDSYEGSIYFDETELRAIASSSVCDLVSSINQDVFLFDDTLLSNITMYREFSETDIAEAVESSGLAPLVAEKGLGYRCGENGSLLSGGERQRVSIARAVLRKSPVLLLDEATSSLDNKTADAVTDSILSLSGTTRIMVTHRLDSALLRRCDRIFVLHRGKVVESGAFSELMGMRGFLYSLYRVTADS